MKKFALMAMLVLLVLACKNRPIVGTKPLTKDTKNIDWVINGQYVEQIYTFEKDTKIAKAGTKVLLGKFFLYCESDCPLTFSPRLFKSAHSYKGVMMSHSEEENLGSASLTDDYIKTHRTFYWFEESIGAFIFLESDTVAPHLVFWKGLLLVLCIVLGVIGVFTNDILHDKNAPRKAYG